MSGRGQALGAIGGAIAGYLIGGDLSSGLKGALYGSQVGAYLDGPPGTKTYGPRINDLAQQSCTYGAFIPRVYGTTAIFGNVFWLENGQIKEVVTEEEVEGGKGGGGGGSYTTYSYFGTFAVGLCKGPIAGVKRIWISGKLFYDACSTDQTTLRISNANVKYFTLHNGSETQLPDSRMQATLGVANTPAYRGLAYLVFKDLPLADYGNSIRSAQIKVEVVQNGSVNLFTVTTGYSTTVNRNGLAWTGSGLCAVGSELIADVSSDGLVWEHYKMPGYSWMDVASNGRILVAIPKSTQDVAISRDGGRSWVNVLAVLPSGNSYYRIIWNGSVFCVTGSTYCAISADGISWIWGRMPRYGEWRSLAWNGFEFCCVASQRDLCATSKNGLNWTVGKMPVVSQWMGIAWNGSIFCAISRTGVSAVSPDGLTWTSHASPQGTFDNLLFGAGYFFTCSDAAIIYSSDGETWTQTNALPVNRSWGPMVWNGTHFCVYDSSVYHTPAIVLPKIFNPTPSSLANIVNSELLKSNLLTSGDIDIAGLTQSVSGYKVSDVSSIRSALEPLQGAWPFDIVQKGYKLTFVMRGGSSVVSISKDQLDAREYGGSGNYLLTTERMMPSTLPSCVKIVYIDPNREFDTNEQYAARISDIDNVSQIEMAISLTADEAVQIAERLLYLYWMDRHDVSFSTSTLFNQIEPADVVTVTTDYGTYQIRVMSVEYTNAGAIKCKGKFHAPAIYTSTAVGQEGTASNDLITTVPNSTFELLDIPCLTDAMNTPCFIGAMNGLTSGWSGGTLSRTSDSGATWTQISVFGEPGSVIGFATNIIGTSTGIALIDKASVLTVSVPVGSLSSVTEEAMLNGANLFAYGVNGRWEIIAVQNCVLASAGMYTFTDILRGLFGTEANCNNHAVGDIVLSLDIDEINVITTNSSLIGQLNTYRGVSFGKNFEDGSDLDFTYKGVNLECLSPIYPRGYKDVVSNVWTIYWIRRTRVDYSWRDLVDVGLGETTEKYEVDIFSSNTYATLKRTLTSTTPTVQYTSADQVTDFGSVQTNIYAKIYQISEIAGRGFPLTVAL